MAMKRSTMVIIGVVVAFTALLLYSTLAAQQVECTACVTWNGTENCATASAQTEKEALTSVVNTACGPMTQGMDESIRCANLPPQRPQCRTR
jgi:LPS O-antigen subunit length determinant protein (WzzB/FepE family)